MVKSYCTAALRQFLGLTGEAIPIDILKAQGQEGWVRMPRQDLSHFAAAITAWKGSTDGDTHYILRLKQCADWLGLLVGRAGQDQKWEG